MSSLKGPKPAWSGKSLPLPSHSPNPSLSRMGPNSDFRRKEGTEGKKEEGIVGRQTRTSAEFTCETTAAAPRRGMEWRVPKPIAPFSLQEPRSHTTCPRLNQPYTSIIFRALRLYPTSHDFILASRGFILAFQIGIPNMKKSK